jgi:UDP-xylose/UDP-N-acetylglucosamine transporter B4
MSVESSTSTSDFTTGLAILLLAQVFSAYMGAYTEDTYSEFNASWTENLFYSHLFSLPFYLPFAATLRKQYQTLSDTAPLEVRSFLSKSVALANYKQLEPLSAFVESVPQGILLLFINAITQLACISGVNLLSAKSSAVTVTIVLNIRKLVSFILSTLLFGHHLNTKMIIGSTLVFGSGALYGWETSWRIPREKEAAAKKSEKPAASSKQE